MRAPGSFFSTSLVAVAVASAAATLLTVGLVRTAVAESAPAADCEAHAAAVVADLESESGEPLSESEAALVRASALRSCLSLTAEGAAATSASGDSPEAAAGEQDTGEGVESSSDGDDSSGGKSRRGPLGWLFGGDYEEKPGNKRLERRGR